jgi:hypothetical protein
VPLWHLVHEDGDREDADADEIVQFHQNILDNVDVDPEG